MELDLTKENDVAAFMLSSISEKDWNAKADKVIEANHGYPSFWHRAIEAKLIYQKAQKNFEPRAISAERSE